MKPIRTEFIVKEALLMLKCGKYIFSALLFDSFLDNVQRYLVPFLSLLQALNCEGVFGKVFNKNPQ